MSVAYISDHDDSEVNTSVIQNSSLLAPRYSKIRKSPKVINLKIRAPDEEKSIV